MHNNLGLIVILFLITTTSSYAGNDELRSSRFMPKAEKENSCSGNQNNRNVDCKVETERFILGYDMHYGISLHPENNLDIFITPEFPDKSILEDFSSFLSQKSLAEHVGKRFYCDCIGVRYERDGNIFFIVRKAHLFAK